MDEKKPETAAALESAGSWEALPEPETTPTLGSTSPLHDGEVPEPPTVFGSLENDPGKVQFRIMPMLLMHGILVISALLAFGLSCLLDDVSSFIRHVYRIRVGVGFCLPCLAALIPKEAPSRVRVSAAAVCLWAIILVLASEYYILPVFVTSPCDDEKEVFYACLSSAVWAVLCSMPHSLGTTSSIPGSPMCLRLGATIFLAGLATEAAILYGRAAALRTAEASDEAALSDLLPLCLLQWSDPSSYQPNLVGEVLVWLGILVMNATALVEPPPLRVTNPVVKSVIKYKKIVFAVLGPVAVWNNALYAGVVTAESISKDFRNVALVAERDFERASVLAKDAARVAQSRWDELSDRVSITAEDFAQLARTHYWEPVSAYVEEVYGDLVGVKQQKVEDGTADTTIPLEGSSVDQEANTAAVREDKDIYEKAKKADDDETLDQARSGVEDDIEGTTVAQVADDASNQGQQEDDVAEEHEAESTERDYDTDEQQDEDSAAYEGQQDCVVMEEETTAIAEDKEIGAEVRKDAADNEKQEILDEDVGQQHTEEAEQGDTPEEAAKEEESTDTDAEPIDEEPLDAEGADEEDEVGEPQDGVNIDEEDTAPVGEDQVQPESSDGAQEGTGPEDMVHESASQEHHSETAEGQAPPEDENVVKEAEEHAGTQLDEEDEEKVAGDEEQVVPIESQDLEELEAASTETGDEEQKDANVLEEEADVATNDGQGEDEMAEPIVLEDESAQQAERVAEDKDEEEVEEDRSAGEAEDGSVGEDERTDMSNTDDEFPEQTDTAPDTTAADDEAVVCDKAEDGSVSVGEDERTEMSNTDGESSEQTDTALETAADDEDGGVSQTTLEDGPKIDSTSTNYEDSGPVGVSNDASAVVEEQVEIPEELYSRVAEERRTASDAGQTVPDRKTKQRMGPLSKLRNLFRMKRPDPEEPPPAVVPPNGPQDLWLVDPERVYQ